MTLEITNERDAENVVVRPDGDVDLSVSSDLQQSLHRVLSQKPLRLVVDLRGVPYMDSSGVATLVDAMQIARKQKTALVLCGMQEKVRSIFEITRLDRLFTIVNSCEDALRA